MRLLLDDDSQDFKLVACLTQQGHDVATVNSIGLAGADDPVVLDAAVEHDRALVTHNADDFRVLVSVTTEHPGLMVHYSERGLPVAPWILAQAVTNAEVFHLGDISGLIVNLNDHLPR